MKKSKVQINYKSGTSMVVECEDFGLKRIGGDLTSVNWDSCKPNPMFIGVDDIESVWEL